MSDPCLSCQVPGGCNEEHPLCGYRQVVRASDVVRAARYRASNRLGKVLAEIRYASAMRVERAYRAVMEAIT
jgi:hypothetical protein